MSLVLVTLPGTTHRLAPGAAASFARMRAAGMPSGGINDSARTRAEQEQKWADYLAGLLPATAARPGTSRHEKGTALDMSTSSAAHRWMVGRGAEHGWTRPLLHARQPEPWHWEYSAVLDRHLLDPTPALAPVAPAPEIEVPDMRPIFLRNAGDGLIVIVSPTGVRPISAVQWQVYTDLGYKLEHDLETGPFGAVVESLGGLR